MALPVPSAAHALGGTVGVQEWSSSRFRVCACATSQKKTCIMKPISLSLSIYISVGNYMGSFGVTQHVPTGHAESIPVGIVFIFCLNMLIYIRNIYRTKSCVYRLRNPAHWECLEKQFCHDQYWENRILLHVYTYVYCLPLKLWKFLSGILHMGLAFVLLSDRKGTHSFHGKKKKKLACFCNPPCFLIQGKVLAFPLDHIVTGKGQRKSHCVSSSRKTLASEFFLYFSASYCC